MIVYHRHRADSPPLHNLPKMTVPELLKNSSQLQIPQYRLVRNTACNEWMDETTWEKTKGSHVLTHHCVAIEEIQKHKDTKTHQTQTQQAIKNIKTKRSRTQVATHNGQVMALAADTI